MITQLVFSILFMSIALAQTTDVVTECHTTCHARNRSNETGDGSWVVHVNNGISYFYLSHPNLVVIVNQNIQLAGVLDGNNGTCMMLNTITGYGGTANFETNLMYVFSMANHSWDVSGLVDKNYSVITNIITTMSRYSPRVVGENINTQNGYINVIDLSRDYASNLDPTKWESTRNLTGSIEDYMKYTPFRHILYKLFSSGKYTPELGASVYFILLMDMDKQNDAFWVEFSNVTLTIILTLKGKFSRDLMYEYYKIIANLHELPIHVVIRLLNHLIRVIRGVGTIYGNIQLALTEFLWHIRGPFGFV